LMLNMNSVEQQLRKYAEEPVIVWSDDCECKQQVSAVADVLKKFVITERDANNSKPEATSGRNIKFDCETQTEANSRQRDCANADEKETVRRLEDKNGQLSVLVEEYERKIVQLNEEMEHVLRERSSHIHHMKQRYEEDTRALLRKIRDMRDEIVSLKEHRPPTTERGTVDHQQNKRNDHTVGREAGGISNGQQSENQRHRSDERDFGRKRNLPPHLQNRNLPPRLQTRNLPPRLQNRNLPPRLQNRNLPPRLQQA
jgi:predicted RNase H-like nuclease (RuvC/YqgF family)